VTGSGRRSARWSQSGEVSDGRRATGVGTKGRARGWPCTPLGLNDGKWQMANGNGQCLDLLRNPQARQLASSPHCSALDGYGTVPQGSGQARSQPGEATHDASRLVLITGPTAARSPLECM
jgi:hypothetical protein